MSMLTRGRSRFAALGTAGALAATALVFAAPSAQAAEPTAVSRALSWSISTQFIEHLSTRTLGGGATFDETAQTFTFPGASTAVVGDVTTYSYGGSVRGAFAFSGTEYYSVTIAEPQVSVDAEGDGEITAVVSATNAASGGNPAGSTTPARVTVAEFADGAVDSAGVAATPDWTGVLPSGSDAAIALGIVTTPTKPENPVGGASFNPDFLAQLTSGVRAHFYASGATADPKKPVASFVASAVPTVTTSTLSASYADGVDVRIVGSGFNPSTQPGDAGVYVGIAPADAVIDFNDREAGTAAMVAVDWVMPNQFTNGAFTKFLNLPTAKLVKGKEYAIYTWQAHTYSNPSQDTITPVAIDWNALTPPVVTPPVTPPAPAKVAPKLTLKVTKAPTTRKAGRAVLTVKGSKGAATGKVKVQVLKGKKVVKNLGAKSLKKGKLTVALPKRPKGTYKVKVTYVGNTSYKAASTAKAFKVRKR